MKTTVSLAVAAALSVGVAHAAITAPGSGQGELIEWVVDTTNNTVYARGTQISELSVLPASSILGKTAYNTLTNTNTTNIPVSAPFTFAPIAADSNLNTFLAQTTGGVHDSFQWGVVGAGQLTISTAGANAPGGNTVVFTTPNTIAAGNLNIPSNANNGSNVTSVIGDVTTLNGIIGGAAGDGSSAVVTAQFSPSSTVFQLYGSGFPTLAALGSNMNLYSETGSGNGAATSGQLYTAGLIVMLANGTLELAPSGAVPLPGAVWLFGSGLLSLFGFARRRAA